jgi:hypothetical protein
MQYYLQDDKQDLHRKHATTFQQDENERSLSGCQETDGERSPLLLLC